LIFKEVVLTIDPVAFRLFNMEIRWYGLLIAFGLIAGIIISYLTAKYRKFKADEILNFAPFAIIAGIIGARLLHVIVNWSYYSKNLSSIFAFRQGGLAIQGVIIGGFIALIIFVRVRKIDLWGFADCMAPSLALAQAIGRWGNFFNQEAYGKPTAAKIGIFISPENRLRGYESFEYFHPTFLYESIANILLFIILMILHAVFRKKEDKIPNGVIFNLYLIIYSLYRVFIEYYRIDSSMLGSIKVVYIISGLTIIAAFIILNVLANRFIAKKRTESENTEEK
jgi:phosphatidylglycerol:prolipoprotein diacylglycerol transferase